MAYVSPGILSDLDFICHSTVKNMVDLMKYIRTIPDFPKPGILFYDISTLLASDRGFKLTIDALVERAKDFEFEAIAGIESRGFTFGSVLAYLLGVGLILVRKEGKLPGKTVRASYALEYGNAVLEVTDVAVQREGQKILIVDDLLATGGTAQAACSLLEGLGAEVTGCLFLIELIELPGRKNLAPKQIEAVIRV